VIERASGWSSSSSVACGLGHVRRRENALVYVRGLIEHDGRKSLQPRLFRVGEDGACYESMQQFLADSPWNPVLLVRACAQRVAPEVGVAAWVDDTEISYGGHRFAGRQAPVLRTHCKIGNCQVTVSVRGPPRRCPPEIGSLSMTCA
jgi:hypothetical protein